MNILVTGASGYIGGRLVPRLVLEGHQVTCLVRNPGRLNLYQSENIDIRQGDLLDLTSLRQVMDGIEVAYYLVHSMADGVRGFVERDHSAAENFSTCAREAGVRRIIYLGGLGEREKSISPHLDSRQHVGDVLRASGVPTTEFRAAIIIGSGSMSFEMIRYLTERLPILFTPSWIKTLCQPIAIENILDYLVLSLSEPRSTGSIFEIGGPDILTYEEILRGYAKIRHLNRRLVRLPLLSTSILAFGADLITPLPLAYLRILIDGLRSEVVVHDQAAQEVFKVKLLPYEHALQHALKCSEHGEVDAYFKGRQPGLTPGTTHKTIEGVFIEQRRLESLADPDSVYGTFAAIGAQQGWFYMPWLWHMRGLIDKLLGGVGLRKAQRSNPARIQPGDVVGGYRVELVDEGHQLRLRNEMKAPGPAWMQFEVQPGKPGGSLYIQTSFFEPHGLAGLAYWYILYPFHQLIFSGMARAIIRRAHSQMQ